MHINVTSAGLPLPHQALGKEVSSVTSKLCLCLRKVGNFLSLKYANGFLKFIQKTARHIFIFCNFAYNKSKNLNI